MKSWRRMAEKLHGDEPCELEYVGFWSRTLAGVIDFGLLAAMLLPVLRLAESGPDGFIAGGVNALIALLLAAAAALLFWLAPGTTPGKLAIAAEVVDERTGCPPAMAQRIGRAFGVLLSLVPLGLGFLWVAFHPKKQGWHDKLAGTLVVRARRARRVRSDAAARIGENEAAAVPRR